MSKFYVYDNASRRLKNGPYTYLFDVVEQFGGAWRGVLQLDDEAQIANLATFGPRLGVTEISEEEFNRLLKKKLSYSKPTPDIIRLPTPALAVADHVALKSPLKLTTPNSKVEELKKPTVEDAVVIGKAPFVDPLDARSNSKKSGKK